MKNKKSYRKSLVIKAFTLIELLITIAIIAILAGMLLPALNKARATAQQSTCISNMKQVYLAQNDYMDAYEEWLPAGGIRVDNYIFPDKKVSDTITGPAFLLYSKFLKTPMAAFCPEAIKIKGTALKKSIAASSWSSIGSSMFATVIYQNGTDASGKTFASLGYARQGKFSKDVVFPNPRKYKSPSSLLLNIDANSQWGTPAIFQPNSNMSEKVTKTSWSDHTRATTVLPSAAHNNMVSAGSADGSVRTLKPTALKQYRVSFYRDQFNISHQLK